MGGACSSGSQKIPLKAATGSEDREKNRSHAASSRVERQDIASSQQDGAKYECKWDGVKVNEEILCLDSFTSKYTGERMQKWRESTIKVFDGIDKTSKVLVSYKGWASKYDKWIDLELDEDLRSIAPLGYMTLEQQEAGGDLDEYQYDEAVNYWKTGIKKYVNKQLDQNPETDQQELESAKAGGESAIGDSKRPDSFILKKGMKIDVQDVIGRHASGELSANKWRKAEVLEIAGSKLRVHFVGWESSFDEILDMNREWGRVRQSDTMTRMTSPSKLRKAKTLNGRMDRRSFDSSPVSNHGNSSSSNRHYRSYKDEGHTGIDYLQTHESSEIDNAEDEEVNTEADQTEAEDETPSLLLSNKESSTKKKKKRHLSFTGKNGKVVPMGIALNSHGSNSGINRRHSSSAIESGRRASIEVSFRDRMEAIGLHLVDIEPDGNCLFRAVSHQLYCIENKHVGLRAMCVQHMQEHRERFEIFCTSDFDSHCRKMSMNGTWAGELEIRALEEIVDRVFSIYSSETKESKPVPMATNFDESILLGLETHQVKLSYHGNHYNSIYDQKYAFPLPKRYGNILLQSRETNFGT